VFSISPLCPTYYIASTANLRLWPTNVPRFGDARDLCTCQ